MAAIKWYSTNSWAEHYLTIEGYRAICNICDKNYLVTSKSRLLIQEHLKIAHNRNFIMETDFIRFYTIQNDKVRCDMCSKTYEHTYT